MPLPEGTRYRYRRSADPSRRTRVAFNKQGKVVEIAQYQKRNGSWTRTHLRHIK